MLLRISLVIGLLSALPVQAAESYSNNIWLNYSRDEKDTVNMSGLLSLAVGQDDQIILGAARTETAYLNETLTSYDYLLTYSTLRAAPWSFDLGYEFWGKAQELVIQTIRLGGAWQGTQWSLGANLEQRLITIYSRQFISGQRAVDVDSTGIGPEFELQAGNWSWSLNGMVYDYSRNFSNLNLARVLLLLGARTFLHTTALTDWYAITQLKYSFTSSAFGTKYSHSISALDQAATDSVSLVFDFVMSKRITLDLEVGRTFAPNDVTTDFGSAGLSIDF